MIEPRVNLFQVVGMGSGLATLASIFAPAVTIAFVGTSTLFADTPVLASLVAVTGLLAGISAWQEKSKRQLACCFFALLLTVLAFYRTLIAIGLAKDGLEVRVRQIAEAGGMSQAGLPIDSMMAGTQLEWGWYVLVGSILVSLISALISMRNRPRLTAS